MTKKLTDKDRERLRELIQEAVVDSNGESEEHMGLMTMIEENVVCPFTAKVIGEEVEVVSLGSPQAGFGLDAVCRFKGRVVSWPRKGV